MNGRLNIILIYLFVAQSNSSILASQQIQSSRHCEISIDIRDVNSKHLIHFNETNLFEFFKANKNKDTFQMHLNKTYEVTCLTGSIKMESETKLPVMILTDHRDNRSSRIEIIKRVLNRQRDDDISIYAWSGRLLVESNYTITCEVYSPIYCEKEFRLTETRTKLRKSLYKTIDNFDLLLWSLLAFVVLCVAIIILRSLYERRQLYKHKEKLTRLKPIQQTFHDMCSGSKRLHSKHCHQSIQHALNTEIKIEKRYEPAPNNLITSINYDMPPINNTQNADHSQSLN
jgi:hypothetical protein